MICKCDMKNAVRIAVYDLTERLIIKMSNFSSLLKKLLKSGGSHN